MWILDPGPHSDSCVDLKPDTTSQGIIRIIGVLRIIGILVITKLIGIVI